MNVPVIRQTLAALAKAQDDYESWSGGDWLWAAPEYMATVSVARHLDKLDPVAYVTMENRIASAIKDGGGSVRGRPNSSLPPNGRFDLVVWNQRGPRVLIEVKTSVGGYASVSRDAERLCLALTRASDIRLGLVAYYVSFAAGKRKPAPDRVRDRGASIARGVDSLAAVHELRMNRHESPIRVVGESAWTVEVLAITPL